MPQNIYQNWLKSMQNFKASIDKELEEMRRCKAEMQQLKQEIANQFSMGVYQRDNNRIVISAPEIIIGNVLKDGSLIPNEPSTVIIRSNTIRQEGVGTAFGRGCIINKAPRIQNVCADAGVDGYEAVVGDDSMFTVQAQGIALQSESTDGTFVDVPSAGKGEINLQADEHVTMAALAPLAYRKSQIVDLIKSQEDDKKKYEDEAKNILSQIESCTKTLSQLYDGGAKIYDGKSPNGDKEDFQAAPNVVDIEELHQTLKLEQSSLNQLIREFQESTSRAAEASRKVKSLKAEQKKIETTQENVKNHKSTNAAIDIYAENTNIQSVNANYEICTSESAGLDIAAKNVEIGAIDHRQGVICDSTFSVNTQHINLSTANKKFNGDKLEMPAEGDVKITSRAIVMESVDKEYDPNNATSGASDEGPIAEKELTKGGMIQLRAKNIYVKSQTTDGQAEGEFNVNSKIVKMGALNQSKNSDNLTVAKGSLLDLSYEGASIASTEWLSVSSDKKTVVSGKEDLELQQDFDKAAIQLNNGKATLKGKDTNIMGTTTLTGKATFKADANFATATVKELTVSSAIKTPNSNEGTPGAPASAADETLGLLMKLTELEQKIKEINQQAEQTKKQEDEQVEKDEEAARKEASKPLADS